LDWITGFPHLPRFSSGSRSGFTWMPAGCCHLPACLPRLPVLLVLPALARSLACHACLPAAPLTQLPAMVLPGSLLPARLPPHLVLHCTVCPAVLGSVCGCPPATLPLSATRFIATSACLVPVHAWIATSHLCLTFTCLPSHLSSPACLPPPDSLPATLPATV